MKKLKLFLSLLMLFTFSMGTVWADAETIASGTFNGKNATYTTGWSTTGTGKGRTDCIIIGKGENVTSPSVDLSQYESITISIKARRYGSISGSKATIAVAFAGVELGTVDATSTTATTSLTDIEYTVVEATAKTGTFVFTCTNATSAGSSHGAGINSITITGVKKQATPTTCTSEITITKADDPANGTFALDNSGTVCIDEGNATVNVTATPAEHYHLATVASTVGTIGTISGNTCAITDIDANTTISVTFAENEKFQVTWNVNGNEDTKTNVYAGEKPVFPATPAACDATSTTFIGWATAPWTGKLADLTSKTVYTSASAMPDVDAAVTYYAVFAKSSGSASNLFSWAGGGKAGLLAIEGIVSSSLDGDYADSHSPYMVKWNSDGKYLIIPVSAQPGKVSAGFKMIGGATTSTVDVQESTATDGEFTTVETLTISGSSNDIVNVETSNTFKSTTRAIKLLYHKGSNVGLGPISIEGAVSMSDYMTTCCTQYNVNIAAGIENGSVSADPTSACEGATITLTFTPALNYHLSAWTLGGVEQDIAESSFTMPGADVTVSATFAQDACDPLGTPSVTVSGKAYPYNAVKLAWTAIEHADAYKVYIYDNEDNELEHNDAFAGVEYTIGQTLSASTTYKYSVQAISNTPATYCPSTEAASTFTTDALPTAHLTLIALEDEQEASGDYAILTPFNLPTTAADCSSKTFVGWDADPDCATTPTYAKGAEFTFPNTTDVTLYAVYATETPGSISLTKLGSGATFADGDKLVIAAKGTKYAIYFENAGSAYVKNWEFAGDDPVLSELTDNKKILTLVKSGDNWKFGDATNGYFYSSGSNNLEISTTNSSEFNSFVWNTTEEAFTITKTDDRYLNCRTDLTSGNANLWRFNGTNTNSGSPFLYVYKYAASASIFDNYSTSCPTCATVTLSAASVEHGSIALSTASVSTCEAATVIVTASPATGYELSGVTLSGVDGATYSEGVISIPQDAEGTLTVTASFSAIDYTVTMVKTGCDEATISNDQTQKHVGEVIEVTANEPKGFAFLGWSASPAVEFDNAKALSTTFTMPASDVTVTATYGKLYTVAEAAAKIDEDKTATTTGAVVEGYITTDEVTYNSKYSSLTYCIQAIDADGFLTGAKIKVYSGKGLNNTDFTSTDDIVLGAKVRVYGELLWYSNEEVYEINYNNYLLAYDAPENPSVVVYGTAAKTAYEVGDSFEFVGLSAKTAYDNKYATAIENPTWAAVPATIAANTTSVSVTANGEGAKNIDVTVLTHELSISATNGTVVVEYQGAAVEAGEHFVKGDVLTITATPASADYALTSLTVNGDAFVSGNTYEVGTEDIAVEATFTEKSAAGISWSESAVNVTLGDTYVLPTLNNPNSLTVELSSTNEAVAYLDEGQIKIAGAGETTISAEFAGNDTYKASTVSYTLTVITCATLPAPTNVTVTNITHDGATFNWDYDAIANADGYYLEVALYDDPTDIKAQLGGLTKGELPLSVNYLLAGTHYVYKVRAFSNDEVNYCDNGWGETYVGDFTTAAPPTYSLKNNWNGGEWAWKEMTYVDGEYILENVVFGGTGVNWRQGDSGDGTWVELASFEGDNIQAWDTVTLAFNPYRKDITATLNSRAVVEFGGSWTQDWSEGKIKAVVSSDNTYAAVKKELTKGDWYNFKPVVGGHWLGCSAGPTGINRTSNSVHGFVYQDGDNHIYFYADVTGEYEFKWVYTTNTVIVTFPHIYTVVSSAVIGTLPSTTIGELVKQGSTDTYLLQFTNVDHVLKGSYDIEVYEDNTVDPVAATTLEISATGLYNIDFTFNASEENPAKALVVEAVYQSPATDIDNTGDGQKAVKVMKDNTIYIIRGDKTYTITGQVVK